MTKVTLNGKRVNKQDRRKFRTEIPNIVDDLNLSPRAFRLYVHIRRVAGESGECWQSTETLSKACHMATGSVSAAKKELLKGRPELGGKSLITESDTDRKSDCYTVTDIWDENLAHYSAKKATVQKMKDASADERQVQNVNDTVHYMNDEPSYSETNNKHREEVTPEEITIEESPSASPYGDSAKGIEREDKISSISEDILNRLRMLVPVVPEWKNQRDALRQLANHVSQRKFTVNEILLCAESLLEEYERVPVTPVSILNHIGTYLAKISYDGSGAEWMIEYSHRPELYKLSRPHYSADEDCDSIPF